MNDTFFCNWTFSFSFKKVRRARLRYCHSSYLFCISFIDYLSSYFGQPAYIILEGICRIFLSSFQDLHPSFLVYIIQVITRIDKGYSLFFVRTDDLSNIFKAARFISWSNNMYPSSQFIFQIVLRSNLLGRRISTVFLRDIVDDQKEVIRFFDNIDTIVYPETQDNQSRHGDIQFIYIYICSQWKSRCPSSEINLIRHTESCSCHFRDKEVFQIWTGSVSVQFCLRYWDL